MALTPCGSLVADGPIFSYKTVRCDQFQELGRARPTSARRYTFHNQWMLRLALVHSSAFPVPGTPCSSGIHLAWIGDSALNLIVTEQLMAAYSSSSMGELSAARSRLISREMCRRWAKHYLACAQSSSIA